MAFFKTSLIGQCIFCVCASLPFVWLCIIVQYYGIDVWHYERLEGMTFAKELFIDGDVMPLLHRFQIGLHRAPLSICIGLLRMMITNGDMRYALIASPLLALISTVLLYRISLRSLSSHTSIERRVLGCVLCVFACSITQWESWTRAFSVILYSNTFFIIALIILVCGKSISRLFLAALFCFFATFSFSHGIVSWVALVPFLVSREGTCWHIRRKAVWLWTIALFGTVVLFFVGRTPSVHALTTENTQSFWHVMQFILVVLGSPLYTFDVSAGAADPVVAMVLGAVVCTVFVITVGHMFWKDRALFSTVRPWMSVFVFSFGSAVLIALGRANLGLDMALSSRYITMGYLALISMMYMVHISVRDQHVRYALLGVWILFAGMNIYQGVQFVPRMQQDVLFFRQGKACLEVYTIASKECLGHLHVDGEVTRAQAAKLEQLGFLTPFTITAEMEFITSAEGRYGEFAVANNVAEGWAALEHCKTPHRVVLTAGSEHTILGLTVTGMQKEMPPAACNANTGWSVVLNESVLGKLTRGQAIEAWAYDAAQHRMFKLHDISAQ